MKLKNLFQRVFIDGLGGMGLGLFATLIIGTIIQQVGTLIGGTVGSTLFLLGKIIESLAISFPSSILISILYEQTLASDMLRSRPHPDQPVPGQEVLLPCTPRSSPRSHP